MPRRASYFINADAVVLMLIAAHTYFAVIVILRMRTLLAERRAALMLRRKAILSGFNLMADIIDMGGFGGYA